MLRPRGITGQFTPTAIAASDLQRHTRREGDCWLPPPEGLRPLGSQRGTWRWGGRTVREVLWEAVKGEVPKGHTLYAGCGSRTCVNPDHQKLKPRHHRREVENGLGRALRQEMKMNEENVRVLYFEFFSRASAGLGVELHFPTRGDAEAARFALYTWRKREKAQLPPDFQDVKLQLRETPNDWVITPATACSDPAARAIQEAFRAEAQTPAGSALDAVLGLGLEGETGD